MKFFSYGGPSGGQSGHILALNKKYKYCPTDLFCDIFLQYIEANPTNYDSGYT